MQNPEILHNGRPVTVGYAMELSRKYAEWSEWDPLDLSAVWSRLLDANEEYEERIICAEMVTSLTQDTLEFLVPEPP
jgi:hypothetical protein